MADERALLGAVENNAQLDEEHVETKTRQQLVDAFKLLAINKTKETPITYKEFNDPQHKYENDSYAYIKAGPGRPDWKLLYIDQTGTKTEITDSVLLTAIATYQNDLRNLIAEIEGKRGMLVDAALQAAEKDYKDKVNIKNNQIHQAIRDYRTRNQHLQEYQFIEKNNKFTYSSGKTSYTYDVKLADQTPPSMSYTAPANASPDQIRDALTKMVKALEKYGIDNGHTPPIKIAIDSTDANHLKIFKKVCSDNNILAEEANKPKTENNENADEADEEQNDEVRGFGNRMN